MVNCFKYLYLGQVSQKKEARKIWTMSNLIFTKIFELYQVPKCLDIHKGFWNITSGKMSQYSQIVYTLNTLLSKSRLSFFFIIFWHAKIPPSFRMPRYWHFHLSFFKRFTFSEFYMPNQKSESMFDKIAVLIRLKIKTT